LSPVHVTNIGVLTHHIIDETYSFAMFTYMLSFLSVC
jgi:hypothetical protein